MKNIVYILLLTSLCSLNSLGQVKAFEGAFGASATITTGGRGGSVYHVTNLNDSGVGSFRDAVSASNRIIVFDVSGTINLTSSLNINADNLTIAGQTAPEGGISITGQSVYFSSANNIITRFIRFRPIYRVGGSASTVGDALNVSNSNNSIIDHCSVSWGGDEAFSVVQSSGNSDNWIISNNIFAESKTGTLIGNADGSPNYISLHGNLWYNISHRHPNVNSQNIEIINNMVHNWFTRLSVMGELADNQKVNQIGNYYQRGSVTSNVLNTPYVNWIDVRTGTPDTFVRVYTEGNVIDGVMTSNQDSWVLGFYKYRFDITSGTYAGANQWDIASTDFQSNTQFPLFGTPVQITSAIDARDNIIAQAGACKTLDGSGNIIFNRDAIDNHYISYVQSNTYQSYSYSVDMENGGIRNRAHYIDYQNSISSTPLNTRDTNYDTDNDGMPDLWETATFGDLTRTSNGDEDVDGYTNIEEYLNLIDGTPVNRPIIVRTDSNPLTYTVGQTYLGVTGIWTDIEDGSGTATVGGDTVNTNIVGDYNVSLNHTDSNGNIGSNNYVIKVVNASGHVLESVVLSGSDYILTFSQTGESPTGGYDTYVDGVDQNDNAIYSGLTRTITGLDTGISHTFSLEARYTQYDPSQFLQSNSITVTGLNSGKKNRKTVLKLLMN